MSRETEITPQEHVKSFSWNPMNFLIPLEKNSIGDFSRELFQGFKQAENQTDGYWDPVYISWGVRDGYGEFYPLHKQNSLSIAKVLYQNLCKKRSKLDIILKTELIGWEENNWKKYTIAGESGQGLYSAISAGTIDIAGIGKVGEDFVMSSLGHHTVPFSQDFFAQTVEKYNGIPTKKSLPLRIKLDTKNYKN